jgi:hypothetical protein
LGDLSGVGVLRFAQDDTSHARAKAKTRTKAKKMKERAKEKSPEA